MPVPPTNSTRFQTITCNLPTLPTCSLTKLQWLQYGDGVIHFYEIIATILILISTSCPCQATVPLLLYTCYNALNGGYILYIYHMRQQWIYMPYLPYTYTCTCHVIWIEHIICMYMYMPYTRVCYKYVYVINYIHESAMYIHEYMYIPYICPMYTYTYLIYAL